MHLHHLRKADLYGVSVGGEQYKGWAALPAAGETGIQGRDAAAEFIARHSGYDASAIMRSREVTDAAYRAAAHKLHPDKGGDVETFKNLQTAISVLRKWHDE
jgi:hypothetical protein